MTFPIIPTEQVNAYEIRTGDYLLVDASFPFRRVISIIGGKKQGACVFHLDDGEQIYRSAYTLVLRRVFAKEVREMGITVGRCDHATYDHICPRHGSGDSLGCDS